MVEHVFACQKQRLHLVIRTVGIARARTKLGLANLAYNLLRLDTSKNRWSCAVFGDSIAPWRGDRRW